MTQNDGAIVFNSGTGWSWRYKGQVHGPFESKHAAWSDAWHQVPGRRVSVVKRERRTKLVRMTKGSRYNLSTRPVGFKSLSF